jgi:hypothetical protein
MPDGPRTPVERQMAGRGYASLIGLVGGLLIVVGGLIALLGRLAGPAAGSIGAAAGSVVFPLIVFVLGFVVLVVARPRLFWWPGRRTFNALLLIGLGILSWIFAGSSLLVVLGAILAMVAGVVLVVEGFYPRSFSARRWFHRY